MKKQIARELCRVAKVLMAGEELLATNQSYWSWEDDIDQVDAMLFVDLTGALRLQMVRTHTKLGLGAGKRSETLYDNEVGTLDSPKIGVIRSYLAKYGHDRSRAGGPFKRKWTCVANKQEMDLGTIISDKLVATMDVHLEQQPLKSDRREKLLRFVSKATESDLEWMISTLDLHL